ncbi:hypothetical protein BK660_02575 [Pseudomonas brassicacearum]|uniref:Uncharacterized protein n=1 Tax=Pseudomonas brassicacearum TaxID=930166 RepID=A0A423IGM4_9PSED|nr:hypothetical protein [Pseudomonas brassicacearum]RON24575.1 hypothetical protein BK660_02575 [Pseudomonas brassicacearum]
MADKSEEQKMGSELSSLLNFIPSAYYDLIARVCPGMAFWVTLSYKMDFIISFSPEKPQTSVSGADLFILILLSYVSGIVLTGFCVIWDAVSIFILERAPFCTALNLANAATFTQRWKQVSVSIDQVSQANDTAGRILVKAMAEVTLCQNLLTGLIVLACIGSFSGNLKFYAFGPYYIYYLAIGCSLFIAMMFRQAMFLGRVMDLHALYFGSVYPPATPVAIAAK